MNVRMDQRSRRGDRVTERSRRSDRAETKVGAARTSTRATAGSRTGGALAVRNRAGTATPATTTAAQRAYQRRQQRAAAHGDVGALAALPKRRSRFAARIPFVATLFGLLGCGLALTLLLTTRAAEDSYELSAARADNQRLSEEKATLQRDVETADSAPDLAAKARTLGMIPAKDPARLVVGPDGGVVVVGTPTPAQGAPVPLLNGQAPQNTARGATRTPGATPNTTRTPLPNSRLAPVAQSDTAPRPGTAQPLPATPQAGNGGQVQAQGEQLVPMATPGPAASGQAPSAQDPAASASGDQAADAQTPNGQAR